VGVVRRIEGDGERVNGGGNGKRGLPPQTLGPHGEIEGERDGGWVVGVRDLGTDGDARWFAVTCVCDSAIACEPLTS